MLKKIADAASYVAVRELQRLGETGAFVALSFAAFFGIESVGASDIQQWQARIVSIEGQVNIRRSGETDWINSEPDDTLLYGDSLNIGSLSRAAIQLPDGGIVRLDQDTTIAFLQPDDEHDSWLNILDGLVHIISRFPRSLSIVTPFANAGIEGTEFSVEVSDDYTRVTVLEGDVVVLSDDGELTASDGERVVAQIDQAPILELVLRPVDAVQWSLYYAPVVQVGSVETATQPFDVNDTAALIERAARRLAVGRVELAEVDIDKALSADSSNADALALQSIIALTKNNPDDASRLAIQAVSLDNKSVSSLIALSYAQQAKYQLQESLLSLRRAVDIEPENALAQSRLAELLLSLEQLDDALEAAQKANRLNPKLARTHTVLGFAQLIRLDTSAAIDIFEQAIALDQGLPLARLGLGLAHIREGNLMQGREQIEIAVALDPANSLLRSYMGKAYDEESRGELASEQFELAKLLDPNDPTPWYYGAIRKQTNGQPVESLQDLQKSIELNDNRAVFRSRLALDADRAVRDTSVAKVYSDLGFDQLASREASKALGVSPSDHSAHRFLADTYAHIPRHDIARISELLQSQLLQPVNSQPIRPASPYLDLGLSSNFTLSGLGFNEYSRLFEENGNQLILTGLLGNQNTSGIELISFGQNSGLSYSAGLNRHRSDGFRENNDQRNTIINLFAQKPVSIDLDLQAELRARRTEQGDLAINFDPESFQDGQRRNIDNVVFRLGAKVNSWRDSTLLFSGVYTVQDSLSKFESPPIVIEDDLEDSGYEFEFQHIYEGDRFNSVSGLGFLDSDFDLTTAATINGELGDPILFSISQEHNSVYTYLDFPLADNAIWTIGGSYNDSSTGELDTSDFSPKLGLEWNLSEKVSLRSAYFESVKRPLIVGQTIEPTEVAGFNQLFDDSNGSESKRFGAGLDFSIGHNIFMGMEWSRRDIDFIVNSTTESRQETLFRTYLNWIPGNNWAFSLSIYDEDYENSSPFESNIDTPVISDTLLIPMRVNYFSSSRYFSELQITHLYQNVERGESATLAQGDDTATLFNFQIGYRLSRNKGSVSLSIQNLTDQSFMFQDDTYRSATIRSESPLSQSRLIALNTTYLFD